MEGLASPFYISCCGRVSIPSLDQLLWKDQHHPQSRLAAVEGLASSVQISCCGRVSIPSLDELLWKGQHPHSRLAAVEGSASPVQISCYGRISISCLHDINERKNYGHSAVCFEFLWNFNQWILMFHKCHYKQCYIAKSVKCSIKPLSKLLTYQWSKLSFRISVTQATSEVVWIKCAFFANLNSRKNQGISFLMQ